MLITFNAHVFNHAACQRSQTWRCLHSLNASCQFIHSILNYDKDQFYILLFTFCFVFFFFLTIFLCCRNRVNWFQESEKWKSTTGISFLCLSVKVYPVLIYLLTQVWQFSIAYHSSRSPLGYDLKDLPFGLPCTLHPVH